MGTFIARGTEIVDADCKCLFLHEDIAVVDILQWVRSNLNTHFCLLNFVTFFYIITLRSLLL